MDPEVFVAPEQSWCVVFPVGTGRDPILAIFARR